ncbi:hypothetical protein B0T10DRAFT_563638 [Thelonectria olida]|uniref:Uncharacterized protein n=1 Tax=Thelonectria olida TaxID=1576542 RepID=A0A9P8W125_9HYPO|nr:hypothetical protein B0T10DRAFT_563638 [Thelonectria olida]
MPSPSRQHNDGQDDRLHDGTNSTLLPPPSVPPQQYFHPVVENMEIQLPIARRRHPPRRRRRHPPRRRRRRPRGGSVVVLALLPIAHPLSIIIPTIIVILALWWSLVQQVCPVDAKAGDLCTWLLWLSLPIATASFINSVFCTFARRRAPYSRSCLNVRASACILFILALGVTICFILMIYYLVRFDYWSRASEGVMVTLLGIQMYDTVTKQVILTDILFLVQNYARQQAATEIEMPF